MNAFIFDMDGVIVDSERQWKSMEGFFLRSVIPGWGPADQSRIIGMSLHDLYRLLSSEYGLSQSREEFTRFYHQVAEDIYRNKASLIEGFPTLLSALKENEVPVALASSSPTNWIDIVLDRFDLRPSFDAVISADVLDGKRGKPAPDIYLLTASKLGEDPKRCIVIEDSKNGILSARAAGMYCIGFRNGFNQEQDLSAANMVIDSYAELDMPTLRTLI